MRIMDILRIILRVALIAILVGLLVFLSIKIFKLIPQAINSLASATVSISDKPDKEKPATQPVQNTTGGLNGVIVEPTVVAPVVVPNPTYIAPTAPVVKPRPTKVNTTTVRTPTYTKYSYTNYPTYTYGEPAEEYSAPGGRNLKLTLTSVGIINSSGQFVRTNTFRTTDTVSVRFKILNEEDSPTGSWNMRVIMPAMEFNDRVKVLNNLSSIPGESSYTAEARFTGIDLSQGNPVVSIQADPENMIAERNESDNNLSIELRNVQTVYIHQTPLNDYPNNNCYYSNGYQVCPSTGYPVGYNYNNGNPNLYITSVEVGRMSGGNFYQTSSLSYGERVAIRVRVRNTGGYFGNSWTTRLSFNGQYSGYRELFSTNGPIQSGGDQVVYFEINDLVRGNHSLNVVVDTNNNVNETNEGDNTQYANLYIN